MITTEIKRLPDWPARLAAYLEQQRAARFDWGSADCVRFAAGAAHAITGCHLLPVQWSSRGEAAAALRALGGLAAAVGTVLPALARPLQARRGDVVLVQAPGPVGRRQWLAVADAERWWALTRDGMRCGSMALAVRAWEVGHG